MHPTSTPSAHTAKQVATLRKLALSYPDTHEDFPWGHSALKVKGKAFAFLHADADGFSISVKLPDSNALALHLPFAEPTGYGLGKSGWVTARFARDQDAPLEVLAAWLEESFTAIAPKRVLAAFFAGQTGAKQPSAREKPERDGKPRTRVAAKGPTRKAAKKSPGAAASAKRRRPKKSAKKASSRAK
jgi:predicted DNA-binding protein (MmcQ/YjbR family)